MTEQQSNRAPEPQYSYRNLILWREAQEFARVVLDLSRQVQTDRTVDPVWRQLIRAAVSVPANIAEGHGRFTRAAYRNHLSIARGSACEADSLLDLLGRIDAIDSAAEREAHLRCLKLIGALTGRMKDLEIREKRTVRERGDGYVAERVDEDLSRCSDAPLLGGSES